MIATKGTFSQRALVGGAGGGGVGTGASEMEEHAGLVEQDEGVDGQLRAAFVFVAGELA